MSDPTTPTPPSSSSSPRNTVQPCANCTLARIDRPRGSLSATTNPTASWSGSAPFHFDFQGVVTGTPGFYTLVISGTVQPSGITHSWTLGSGAGTLSNATSASPTHNSPAGAGEGDLVLTGMSGSTRCSCRDTKRLKIYQDHLARDRDNFGVGTSCDYGWSFTKYGATISMSSRWNCHGGTKHIYNGTGTGSTGPSGVAFLLDASRLKKTVTVTHTPTGGGTHPSLGALNRGDIVAYYTGAGDLAHTQTCTGSGNETYGANNVPVRFPGRPGVDEAWKWATSPAGDWANNIKENLFTGATPFTIKVFRKP